MSTLQFRRARTCKVGMLKNSVNLVPSIYIYIYMDCRQLNPEKLLSEMHSPTFHAAS